MEDDELQVLKCLSIPRTKSEILEETGIGNERASTILQMLRRNGLAQLGEMKRWSRTELGTTRLEEIEEELEEKPEEEAELPQKVNLTTQFKIHKKQRELLNRCEEITAQDWAWDKTLLKDFEFIKDNIGFIKQKLNEASSLEELEELEVLLEDLDKSWEELFIKNEQLSDMDSKFELKKKLGRIREFYMEIYPELSHEEHEKMIKRCEEDPEQLKIACQHMERENHLESLRENAFEHNIDSRFIRDIHFLAGKEKLELKYVVQLWVDYSLLSSRYGPKDIYHFVNDRGRTFLKKRGSLWEAFHRYMFPQRMPAPGYR